MISSLVRTLAVAAVLGQMSVLNKQLSAEAQAKAALNTLLKEKRKKVNVNKS